MNNDALAKIAMLRNSQRCFVCGGLSLIPIIGLPFAVSALRASVKSRGYEKQFWNAAKPYRIWGLVCAIVGIILGLGLLALYMIAVYNAASGG